uniref:Uncharacterized protein n=1 Tax=Meloidogyne javanica TaxID=6303 RepID=A0A915N2P6_MELJA
MFKGGQRQEDNAEICRNPEFRDCKHGDKYLCMRWAPLTVGWNDCEIDGKSGVYAHTALFGIDYWHVLQEGRDFMSFELTITGEGGLIMSLDGKTMETPKPTVKPTQKTATTGPPSNNMVWVYIVGGVLFVVALIVAASICFIVNKKKVDPLKGGDSTVAKTKVDEKTKMKVDEKTKMKEKTKVDEKTKTKVDEKTKMKEKPKAGQRK